MSAKYQHAINKLTGKLICVTDGIKKFKYYVCPKCGGALVLRDGDSNDTHFAHKGKDCGGGPMTLNHSNSIIIIARQGRIRLPDRTIFNYDPSLSRIEHCCERMRLDVLLDGPEGKLIVEVCVTHKIDERKRAKIKSGKIKVLEIDISDLESSMSIIHLTPILIEEIVRKELIDPAEKEISIVQERLPETIYSDGHFISEETPILEEIQEKIRSFLIFAFLIILSILFVKAVSNNGKKS